MNKQGLTIGAIAALILVVGVVFILSQQSGSDMSSLTDTQQDRTVPPQQTETGTPDTDLSEEDTTDETFTRMANLIDVTDSYEPAAGTAYYGNDLEGNTVVYATFENLPELMENYFYEGWLVRTEPFAFISTGELVQENGEWVNRFETEDNFDDYDQYVLTLEPRDDDPLPAPDHIVEGSFQALDTPTTVNTGIEQDMSQSVIENSSGIFTDYNESLVANAAEGDVVLFFAASWCPSCRALESEITNNLEDIPGDLTILKLDYDTENELKERYNIRTKHSLVQVDANGNEITKWVGGFDIQDIVDSLV